MSDLLPCPFCGDQDPEVTETGDDEFAVVCACCGANGPTARVGCRDDDELDLETEAAADWNKRVTPLRQVKSSIAWDGT